uniref:Uncharacterized protein n=1 Tax=Hippocampus comes TaxID=109280 RepID=A0A3Q2XI44_HIPCM
MASDLEGSQPFSAGLRAIRRLNSCVCRPAGGDRPAPGHLNSTCGSYPQAQHAPLAPERDDLSDGAEGRHNFIDFQHVAPTLEDEAWKSRRVPDAAIRARIHW